MQVLLAERKNIAEGTTEITLDLKGQEFNFKAGQYVNICFPSLGFPDPKGNCREFSICSSPKEKGIIRTAIRNSESGFKRTLLTMPLGSEITLDGPFGLFTIPRKAQGPFALIAGGIGITPFMSMLTHAASENSPIDIILIYANQSVERAAYRKELRNIAAQYDRLTFKENLGVLTPHFIIESVPDMEETTFYVAGPPKMVFDIRQALKGAGVDEEAILAEEFVGYE